MIHKAKRVRFRTMDGGDYATVPFKDCVHLRDGVGIKWIDIFGDELVITTKEEYVYSDGWLGLKPQVCLTCGQEIKNKEE